MFEKAMKEDQKQKIRAIDFTYQRANPILECEVDAIGNGNCFKCGNPGHLAAQCSNAIKCFNCGKPGHYSRECTEPKKAPKPKTQDASESSRPAPKTDSDETSSKLLEAMYSLIKTLKDSKSDQQPKYRSYSDHKYSHNKRPFTKVNEVDNADSDSNGNSSENEDQNEVTESAPKN
jgi:hypothetical protein